MARTPMPAPAKGPPRLEWRKSGDMWQAFHVVERGYSKKSLTYTDRVLFALVRPQLNGNALFSDLHGYVVSRTAFADLRAFPTLDEAKLYVESLFALEAS